MPMQHETVPGQPSRQQLDAILGFLDRGQLPEAEGAARALVQSYPISAVANFALARVLVERRDDLNALNHARQAVQIEPGNGDYLTFLGVLYNRIGVYELAGPILTQALERAPSSFAANWGMANYHVSAGSGLNAIPFFERAFASAADDASRSNVLRDHARCLVSVGEIDKAEDAYARLARIPRLRVLSLAAGSLLRRHESGSPMAAELEAELGNPKLTSQDRSILLQALGRIEENSGHFDEAFELWRKSRALLKVTYRRDVQDKEIAARMAFYRPELFRRTEAHASPSERPVFVVGLPRSGTSLTEQIVASHPQAAGIGELRRMYSADHAFLNQNGPQPDLNRIASLAEIGRTSAPGGTASQAAGRDGRGRDRIVDKNPINFMALGYIHMCFPKARIIHCSRQPADNFISAFQNQMNQAHRLFLRPGRLCRLLPEPPAHHGLLEVVFRRADLYAQLRAADRRAGSRCA